MKSSAVSHKRHHYPQQIISNAVWLYFRSPLSLHLVKESCWSVELSFQLSNHHFRCLQQPSPKPRFSTVCGCFRRVAVVARLRPPFFRIYRRFFRTRAAVRSRRRRLLCDNRHRQSPSRAADQPVRRANRCNYVVSRGVTGDTQYP